MLTYLLAHYDSLLTKMSTHGEFESHCNINDITDIVLRLDVRDCPAQGPPCPHRVSNPRCAHEHPILGDSPDPSDLCRRQMLDPVHRLDSRAVRSRREPESCSEAVGVPWRRRGQRK